MTRIDQTDTGTVLSSGVTCSDFFVGERSAFLSRALVVSTFSYPVAQILSNYVSAVVSSVLSVQHVLSQFCLSLRSYTLTVLSCTVG